MRTDGVTVSMPLHTAVSRGNANIVGVLLRHGADPNSLHTEKYNNERGYNQDKSLSPLHLAIDRGALDLVILLLAEGADPNGIAAWLEQVDSGARGTTDDPRAEGFESAVRCVPVRETALHRALRAQQPDIARALLASGADRSVARVYDGKEESTTAIAERSDGPEGELAKALQTTAGWSPENHKFFSEQLREQVRTVLLVSKASNWCLPDEAFHQIFTALYAAPAPQSSVQPANDDADSVDFEDWKESLAYPW